MRGHPSPAESSMSADCAGGTCLKRARSDGAGPRTNKRFLSEVMSQNLARLNVALTDELGGLASPCSEDEGGRRPQPQLLLHLAHPEQADGLAALEGEAVLASLARSVSMSAEEEVTPTSGGPLAGGLFSRRKQLLMTRPGVDEAGVPPSPSDGAAPSDLRRTALLRSLHRRNSVPASDLPLHQPLSCGGAESARRGMEEQGAAMMEMLDDGGASEGREGAAGAIEGPTC